MSDKEKLNEGQKSTASGKFYDTLVKKIFKCPHCGREITLQTIFPDAESLDCPYCDLTMIEVNPNDN